MDNNDSSSDSSESSFDRKNRYKSLKSKNYALEKEEQRKRNLELLKKLPPSKYFFPYSYGDRELTLVDTINEKLAKRRRNKEVPYELTQSIMEDRLEEDYSSDDELYELLYKLGRREFPFYEDTFPIEKRLSKYTEDELWDLIHQKRDRIKLRKFQSSSFYKNSYNLFRFFEEDQYKYTRSEFDCIVASEKKLKELNDNLDDKGYSTRLIQYKILEEHLKIRRIEEGKKFEKLNNLILSKINMINLIKNLKFL